MKNFKTVVFFIFILSMLSCDGNKKEILNKAFEYKGNFLRNIFFPIGGIGSGDITIGGRGNIAEMEIFNRPNKYKTPELYNMIWVKPKNKPAKLKVIEREMFEPFTGGFGIWYAQQFSGFSRFEEVTFKGEFPFANVEFRDHDIPLKVELQGYNPFIPLDVKNSSIPTAVFNWSITNNGADQVEIALAYHMKNPIKTKNAKGVDDSQDNMNEYINNGKFQGVRFSSKRAHPDSVDFGDITYVTTEKDIEVQTNWYNGGWWDAYHIITDDIFDDGHIKIKTDTFVKTPKENDNTQFATILVHASLKPGETKKIPMYLCWYFPNRKSIPVGEQGKNFVFKNYYSTLFTSASDVAGYIISKNDSLYNETKKFHDALFSSTYPQYVIDAISSQMASLKTNLVVHDAKGNFYGWEGLGDQSGCCEGTCTHVWNYEQTLAFLFPSLERSMREIAFLNDTWDNGFQSFRTVFPPNGQMWQFHPAADGQMGNIVRVYREWKLSGDNQWLKELWPKVKLALEFAWKGVGEVPADKKWMSVNQPLPWDANKDGVMEGLQHNTYDIEFYGPNPMTGTIYLAALKACIEMSLAMNEPDKAKEYQKIYQSGKRYCDEQLWNGNYYYQQVMIAKGLKIPDYLISPTGCMKNCPCKEVEKKCSLEKGDTIPKYQYGEGCLTDQLLGQYLAHVSGLGYILDKQHVDKAMKSVFENNFVSSFSNFNNVQRVYALNDEAGLLLCTWPDKNKRPLLPFPYSDEVWTGIEYQAAASMIYSGLIDQGLQVVKAVRGRYNGSNRNPWDEIECGHHYARAMSSWAVMLALSGFHFDGVNHVIEFIPQLNKDHFFTFWSCGTAWGTFTQTNDQAVLSVESGVLTLQSIHLSNHNFQKIIYNNSVIKSKNNNGLIKIDSQVILSKGQQLFIK